MQIIKKHIEVVAAILIEDNKVYATQRGYGEWKDWWEFPGGKVEPNENLSTALHREIKEELALDINVANEVMCVHYEYPQFYLTLHGFLCIIVKGVPKLLEHESARWLSVGDLHSVKWLPADAMMLEKVSRLLVKCQ